MIVLLLLVPLAVVVIVQVARLISLRRVANRPEPRAPVSYSSAVRVLSSPEDLAAALDRAAATERRVVGIVGSRLARYEHLQDSQAPPVERARSKRTAGARSGRP